MDGLGGGLLAGLLADCAGGGQNNDPSDVTQHANCTKPYDPM